MQSACNVQGAGTGDADGDELGAEGAVGGVAAHVGVLVLQRARRDALLRRQEVGVHAAATAKRTGVDLALVPHSDSSFVQCPRPRDRDRSDTAATVHPSSAHDTHSHPQVGRGQGESRRGTAASVTRIRAPAKRRRSAGVLTAPA